MWYRTPDDLAYVANMWFLENWIYDVKAGSAFEYCVDYYAITKMIM